ncbi:MAG: hypothetical protein HYY20_03085 [Candidatus Tectomicrobia bacterium]|uniref:Uncharacterized protein n=1 Tax=Tectimicrobiota bacterium TaxID=2528274 RepID=A0A932FVW8_UNCTE|nr:hypothetical protein [Candidatus Tectomicrobia bacterium]
MGKQYRTECPEEATTVAVMEEEEHQSGQGELAGIEGQYRRLRAQQEERIPQIKEELKALKDEQVSIERHRRQLQAEMEELQRALAQALRVQAALGALGEHSKEIQAKLVSLRQEQLRVRAEMEGLQVEARLRATQLRQQDLWKEERALWERPRTFLDGERKRLWQQVNKLRLQVKSGQQEIRRSLQSPGAFRDIGAILVFYEKTYQKDLEVQQVEASLKKMEWQLGKIEQLLREEAIRESSKSLEGLRGCYSFLLEDPEPKSQGTLPDTGYSSLTMAGDIAGA